MSIELTHHSQHGGGKILLWQNRKREIIQSTIIGDQKFADALDWDEIQKLLA